MCDFIDCTAQAENILAQKGEPICKLCQAHTDEVEIKMKTGEYNFQLATHAHTIVKLVPKEPLEDLIGTGWQTIARSDLVH